MNPVTVQTVIRSIQLLETNEEFQSWTADPDAREAICGNKGLVPIRHILQVYHWARARLVAGAQIPPPGVPAEGPSMGRWRIVEGDNFGGDYPNEKFVSIPATNRAKARMIADAINAVFCAHDHATRYWRAVPEDYTLQPGFEP